MLEYPNETYRELMSDPVTHPRLARLARRALSHYLGDAYNPKTCNPRIEFRIRRVINEMIEEKIKSKKPYQWKYIDYVFRGMFKKMGIEILPDKILERKIRPWQRKSNLYYADEIIEQVMHGPNSYPRYRHLARKALKHYLGNLYDPKTMDFEIEANFRFYIMGCVESKVYEKEPYDWNWIDHFLRYVLSYCEGYTHITYDDSVIDKGYNGVSRGKVTVH